MRRIWIIAIAAALSLGACEAAVEKATGVKIDNDDGAVTITSADGSTSYQSGGSVAVPANLPEFVKLYPGMSLSGAMTGSNLGTIGGTLTGHTNDSFDQVATFYREHAASLGFESNNEMASEGSLILTSVSPDNRSLMVSISNAQSGGVDVSLTYGAPST
jgi:hypothetical protein